MGLAEQIDAITAFEAQIEAAEKVGEELEGAEDTQYVASVLGMFERNATEDDCGVFHAFASYLEQFEGDQAAGDSTVGQLLIASVKRVPMWKTCELLQGIVGTDAAAKAFTEALGNDGLSDTGRECAKSALGDIVDSFPDEVSEPTLEAARKALA